jgi:chromosome segregation ATPase
MDFWQHKSLIEKVRRGLPRSHYLILGKELFMARRSWRAGVMILCCVGISGMVVASGETVVTAPVELPEEHAELKAQIREVQAELDEVSAEMVAASKREISLRGQIQKRAAESRSYTEALPDEDSQALIAKINAMTEELNKLKLELKARMEASDDYKSRDNALRQLHKSILDSRGEVRRLQQKRSRVQQKLQALERALASKTESTESTTMNPAPGSKQ